MRSVFQPSLVSCLATWLALTAARELIAQDKPEISYDDARARMVREEVVGSGIKNERVIEAMKATERHLFVSANQRHLAYFDLALPIGSGQTISPPYIVAFMTEVLDPQPDDRVLEIGTGSGYQAAVLSKIVGEVYSIEIVKALGIKADQTLRRLGYKNVHTKVGDGFAGWEEHAPFDKIIVTCSPEKIPRPLVEQLREGGRIVVPLGERYQQSFYLLTKRNGQIEPEFLKPTYFVPMTGQAEELRENKADNGLPELVNASFETADNDGQVTGWYYVRQAELIADDGAADGKHYLRFTNETPGRSAQALQSMSMDAAQVREIELSLSYETKEVRPGQSRDQLPRIEISFFDEIRSPIGTKVLGPWHGTTSWTKKQTVIAVPPRSRIAVLAVGMFGAVGEFSVDQIGVRVLDGKDSGN